MAAQAAPGTKAARQARIAAILAREQVHSQEQLAGLLSQYTGMHVTQATLSRDLDELGVVRLRAADGTLVYALPADPGGHGSLAGTPLAGSGLAGTPLAGSGLAGTASDQPARTESAVSPPAPGKAAPGRAADGQAADAGPVAGQAPDDTLPAAASQDTGGPFPSPSRAGGASPKLVRYLKELLTSAEASANLVVLRTPAGAAQFLASAIDHTSWPAILGTVAGDDTVLVITRDPVGGEALADYFRRLAEGRR
jgi:transcriptional regulator of arginine metabolism